MSEMTAQMPAADTAPPSQMQKLIAEALGTFVLVFFGAGTAFASGGDYVATALAFGLTVLVMAYAVGHLSGGHFNPAVSIGAALAGRIGWATAAVYIAVQFVAAFVAAGVLAIVAVLLYDGAEWGDVLASVSNKWESGPGANGAAFLGAFLIETIATFVFVFMILAVTDRRRAVEKIPAPVAIGLALTMCHLLLIGITGCSVNPARSLGPGILSFNWDDAMKYQWLFLVAPVVGGAAAGLLHPILFGRDGAVAPGSGLDFRGAADVALGRSARARLTLGDAPQVATLRDLDIAPDPVFTAFFPETTGVLDDHFECWFLTSDAPVGAQHEGLESVVGLGLSEEWLDPPKVRVEPR